ncbi:MAG TPA: hypothetical protein VE262_12230 [Blastocatellia bacterium]|nr:hypothetical protein [Blastocatellia bacterium]
MKQASLFKGGEQGKRKAGRYYSSQFETYRDLWQSLQALKFAGDALWERVSLANIINFANQLRETGAQIDMGAVFFEEEDYTELKALLEAFGRFKMGKYRLLQIHSREDSKKIDSDTASDQIRQNYQYKDEYERLLDRIRVSFRTRLSSVAHDE